MGEDKGDTQLPLSSVLAEKEARLRREVDAARQRAEKADKIYDQSTSMTGKPIPQAREEAKTTEELARSLEQEYGVLVRDKQTLNVPSPRHAKGTGSRTSGRHPNVPLNLLKPLPGLEDATPSLAKGGK